MGATETIDALKRQGIACSANEPMKQHTTFRIGGPAEVYCVPKSMAELEQAIQIARQQEQPLFLLGQGSNVLFGDEGYPGVVIHLVHVLGEIEPLERHRLHAGAGAILSNVCRTAHREALSGLEFAFGIPGSVGGAVFMNAGAYGGEMRTVLESVTYLDQNLQKVTAPVEELELGYRHSLFQSHPWCILSAVFRLAPGDAQKIEDTMQLHMRQRIEKQPLELPSAGSAFKRPEGAFAGALIDQCGFRGYRVGDAAISEKHCGFIVNLGNATSRDVLALAEEVSKAVHEKTGYILEKEIRVVASTAQG